MKKNAAVELARRITDTSQPINNHFEVGMREFLRSQNKRFELVVGCVQDDLPDHEEYSWTLLLIQDSLKFVDTHSTEFHGQVSSDSVYFLNENKQQFEYSRRQVVQVDGVWTIPLN